MQDFRYVASILSISLLLGCTGRTEIVVGVATDLQARGQIDTVRFLASRNGTPLVDHTWSLAEVPLGLYELPGSFGLYSPDGSQPRVELSVMGYQGKTVIAERDSVLSLLSGETLFVRMGLVSDCGALNGPNCAADESCVEGVCRPRLVDAHRLPSYSKDLVGALACDSGTRFIVSSTGAPMPLHGAGCRADEFCQEGTCYKYLAGEQPSTAMAVWSPQAGPTQRVLRALWGTADGADLFAVGEGGVILHLANAGPTHASGWVDETFDPTHDLFGVWGSSAADVYAVGNNGTILHRTGTTWAAESVTSVEKLESVWGSGPNDVWAVGRNADKSAAVLHRTTSWAVVTTAMGGELRGVWGATPVDVWGVGLKFGVARFSTDAFTTVTPPASLTTDLFAVGGSGPDDIYLVGRGGLVAHGDGVTPLVQQTTGSTADLFTVFAVARDDIYVAGDHGVILHSTGNGRWMSQASGTTQPIYALFGVGTERWAAGRDGVILHSTGSGGPVDDLAFPPPADMSALPDMEPPPPDLTPVAFVSVHYVPGSGVPSNEFTPKLLTIDAGTTVIWSWPAEDGGLQTITSCVPTGCPSGGTDYQYCSNPLPSPPCGSPPSPGPFVYSHRYDLPGSYDYMCQQHQNVNEPSLVGTVTVQ
jgi:hypothetical protein